MEKVVVIVLPVFALIALGFLAGRFRWVSEATPKGLADFTFNLAVPAMLFRTMAVAHLPQVAPWKLWGAYFGSAFLIWMIATLNARLALRRPAADGAPIAMSSAFGNVVMLGIPLSLSALGTDAAGPIAVVVSLHTPVLWLVASLHMSLAAAGEHRDRTSILATLVADLMRNPIIMSIAAGTLWRLTGLGLAPVADRILVLLAQASVPAALVALGLSLVKFEIKGQAPTLVSIVVLKLAVMPVIAWLIATELLGLPPIAAGVVIIFAAMPTGANAFLFATKHQRAVNSASGAVALGTALSIATAMIAVYVVGP
ncbi:MAG: AEC family transporter [Hyphomicrobiaceae bacterium]